MISWLVFFSLPFLSLSVFLLSFKLNFFSCESLSNPVAITVILTSPFLRLLLLVAPKITLALGSIDSVIISAASLISIIARSEDPLMLNKTPVAPSIDSSNKGLLTAWRAASTARFSPVALPIPISAGPVFSMTVLTSAKSTLIIPGEVMRSEMP